MFALSNLKERVDYRVLKYLMPRIGVRSRFRISRSSGLSEFPTKRILQSLKRDLADSKSLGPLNNEGNAEYSRKGNGAARRGKFREWPRKRAGSLGGFAAGVTVEFIQRARTSPLFAVVTDPSECRTSSGIWAMQNQHRISSNRHYPHCVAGSKILSSVLSGELRLHFMREMV